MAKRYTPISAAADVETALRMLEGRWKLVILFQLFGGKVKRFSELERAIPNITQKCSANNSGSWRPMALYTGPHIRRCRRRLNIGSQTGGSPCVRPSTVSSSGPIAVQVGTDSRRSCIVPLSVRYAPQINATTYGRAPGPRA
jgi:hypothetical protein